MKRYKIPMEYKVCEDFEIKANSLNEAIEKAKERFVYEIVDINEQYVDDSLYIDREYLDKYGEQDAESLDSYKIGDQVNSLDENLQFIGHNPFGEIIGFDNEYLIIRDIDGDSVSLLPEQVTLFEN